MEDFHSSQKKCISAVAQQKKKLKSLKEALVKYVRPMFNESRLLYCGIITVYTRVQVKFFGREKGLKKSTSTYIRENMRHTYRITKKCQNSLQQAKLRS